MNDRRNSISVPQLTVNPLAVEFPANRAGISETSVRVDALKQGSTDDHPEAKEPYYTPPDEYFGYRFKGKLYRILRESFLVSTYSRIHRAGFRSNYGVNQERYRHLSSFPWIIHPYSLFRWTWEVCMTIALKLTLIRQPILLSYEDSQDRSSAEFLISIWQTLLFLLDIVLNFRTGIVSAQSDTITLDPYLISRSYLRSWFFIDLVSTVPYDTILHMLVQKKHMHETDLEFLKYLRLLELLKIFRLSRVIRYITRLQESFLISRLYIRIFNLHIVMFYALHWISCMHYMVADLFNPEGHRKAESWVTKMDLWDKSVTTRYINSVIRALSNMAMLGYGLEVPRAPEDIVCTIFSILIGATFFAMFVGSLSNMLINMDVAQKKYVEVLNQVLEYLRFKQVPKELQHRVVLYYEQRYRRNFFNEHLILSNVSNVLREELQMYNCRSLVEEVPLFKGLPNSIIQGIVSRLKFEVYLPQDIIMSANTLGDSMFFIEHGAVSVMAPSGRIVAYLRDGDFFGELALLTNERRIATIAATSFCDVYRLERSDFEEVVVTYPKIYEQLITLAEERAKQITTAEPAQVRNLYHPRNSSINEQKLTEIARSIRSKLLKKRPARKNTIQIDDDTNY